MFILMLTNKFVLSPHQWNFCFQQTKATTEDLWGQVPMNTFIKYLPYLRLRDHYREGDRKTVRARTSGNLLCLPGMLEAMHIKSHQCDCLNISWARTTIDTLMWTGGKHTRLQLRQKTTGNWRMLRMGEIILFREKHTNWLSTTKWLVPKAYM